MRFLASKGYRIKLSKTLSLIFLLVFLPLVSCYADQSSTSSDRPSSQDSSIQTDPQGIAPDFSERDIFGKQTIALNSYRGKVVMLNFWATWCQPCTQEIPALESLADSYRNNLVVIGIAVYSYYSATEQFYMKYKVNYPMINGSYELMYKYGKVSAIPTTFIIDKDGKIAAKVVGSRARDQYEKLLSPLLGK